MPHSFSRRCSILHLVRFEDSRVAEDRVLVPDAQPYHQSRTALWVSPRALIYIAGDKTTRQLDILTGQEEILIPDPNSRFGMLVNATHTHATNGLPTFSIYHPADRTVSRRTRTPISTRSGSATRCRGSA